MAIADIHRKDFRRASLKQAISEASRGRADIEGDRSLHRDVEGIQGGRELDPAAAHEGMLRADDLDVRVDGDLLRRPGRRRASYADGARHDQPLRTRPALRQPTMNHHDVQTLRDLITRTQFHHSCRLRCPLLALAPCRS